MSPRGGDALHAFEVETLEEKAARLNREQGLPEDFQHPDPPRHEAVALAKVRAYAESRCTPEHGNMASASWILHLIEEATP